MLIFNISQFELPLFQDPETVCQDLKVCPKELRINQQMELMLPEPVETLDLEIAPKVMKVTAPVKPKPAFKQHPYYAVSKDKHVTWDPEVRTNIVT